jgi:beta-lactamase superfamily II metal-dependent hydrolase
MYNIHLLPAAFGDSILIEYGPQADLRYILIDGGPYYNYEKLISAIEKVAPGLKSLELLVVTHVDIDHIDGIVKMLNQQTLPFKIEEIWFNGLEELKKIPNDKLGSDQGDYLSILIGELGIPHNQTHFKGGPIVIPADGKLPIITLKGGMGITLLSPDIPTLKKLAINWGTESKYLKDPKAFREQLENDYRYKRSDILGGEKTIAQLQSAVVGQDNSLANASSIAFIAKYQEKTCLFAGDATTPVLLPAVNKILKEEKLTKLAVDAWKLAHHGSKKSTREELMEKMDTPVILVCSDGTRYSHPDPETIAKLLKFSKSELTFYFNYLTKDNGRWENPQHKSVPKFNVRYGDGEMGISLVLVGPNKKPVNTD